jgi:hypothetical protein
MDTRYLKYTATFVPFFLVKFYIYKGVKKVRDYKEIGILILFEETLFIRRGD